MRSSWCSFIHSSPCDMHPQLGPHARAARAGYMLGACWVHAWLATNLERSWCGACARGAGWIPHVPRAERCGAARRTPLCWRGRGMRCGRRGWGCGGSCASAGWRERAGFTTPRAACRPAGNNISADVKKRIQAEVAANKQPAAQVVCRDRAARARSQRSARAAWASATSSVGLHRGRAACLGLRAAASHWVFARLRLGAVLGRRVASSDRAWAVRAGCQGGEDRGGGGGGDGGCQGMLPLLARAISPSSSITLAITRPSSVLFTLSFTTVPHTIVCIQE